ncbi:MAG: hypothetical protein RR486_16145 [Clostridium sp.]|uniref:hypothetical protein n=1 Tax=Clostridium sp. TaxID=1506 RepID=UPI0030580F14
MKHLHQRNIRIISELSGYLVRVGCNDMHIDFNTIDNITHIIFTTTTNCLSEENINELKKLLNLPRRKDIEEYYWELNGDDDFNSELSLIGMMTDSANITYDNNILEINLIRSL